MLNDNVGMPAGAGRASASPTASTSPSPLESPTPYFASPAPVERIPYALPPGPDARLWLYDRVSDGILVFPGAGVGIENVFEWNPYQFYYDDRRDIFLLDALREIRVTLVEGFEVGGFAFSPAFDGKNNLYFLGTPDPDLAAAAIGFAYVKPAPLNGTDAILGIATGSANGNGTENATGSANGNGTATESATGNVLAPILGIREQFPLGPVLGKPVFLTTINAVGALHGGISSINVSGPGDWVVFTTADGGLYLFDTRHLVVQAVISNGEITGGVHASAVTIDPIWGRYVVWQDTERQSIFILDRLTNDLDSVPYVAIAWNAISVLPAYYGYDPYNVILLVTLSDGTFRLMVYNLVTELLTNLTWLNAIPGLP